MRRDLSRDDAAFAAQAVREFEGWGLGFEGWVLGVYALGSAALYLMFKLEAGGYKILIYG